MEKERDPLTQALIDALIYAYSIDGKEAFVLEDDE